jgi:branched-chain amino acid transport system permease protein
VRTGSIAGGVVIYLALVGLLTKLIETYVIAEVLSLAFVLEVLPVAIAGYLAGRPRVVGGEEVMPTGSRAAAAGATLGAAAGAVVGAFILLVTAIGVERFREVFIQVSPELMEFLTWGKGTALGIALTVAVMATFGAAAAFLRTQPDRVRSPIVVAIAAVVIMGASYRVFAIMLDELDIERDWLYSKKTTSLTWAGAALIAVVAGGLRAYAMGAGAGLRQRITSSARQPGRGRVIWSVVGIALVLLVPQAVGAPVSEKLGQAQVFIILGLGLNIVVGYAGLLDLGYVAFYAFGAYAIALLTGGMINTFEGPAPPAFGLDLNFYVAIPIVVLMTAGLGLLLGAPVLRLRGDYLALVTLGLGEVVSTLVRSPWLEPLVGGPSGMTNITDASIAGYSFRPPQHFYYLALGFIAIALFVSWRLINSRIGRAWTAMREDEQIADAMGVSTTRFKLLAFAVGGAIGSLAGALFAVRIGSITPASFEVIVSIQVLGVVVLGGLGSLRGVIAGGLVLVGLPGLLREFEEFQALLFGAALVGIMIWRPQGLIPNVRRSRELHEEDTSQDKWAGDLAADEHVAPGATPIGEGSG